MQESIEAVHTQSREQRKFLEQRNTWLEMKLNTLERRCEKAEKASDHLRASFQDFNFNELVDLPRRVFAANKAANKANNNESRGERPRLDRNDPDFETEVVKYLAGLSADQQEILIQKALALPAPECCRLCGKGDDDSSSNSRDKDLYNELDRRITTFDSKVKELLSQAQEWSEMRKLFWKIDINVRKILSGEEAGSSSPQGAYGFGNSNAAATRGTSIAPRPGGLHNESTPDGHSRSTSHSQGRSHSSSAR